MDRKWMRLIEQGGDASIGSALVRLARQASSVHMHEAARQIARDADQTKRVGDFGGTEAPHADGWQPRTVAQLEAELAEAAAAEGGGR